MIARLFHRRLLGLTLTLALVLNLVIGSLPAWGLARARMPDATIATFPIYEPFTGTTAPNFIYGGQNFTAHLTAGAGEDPDGQGWLRLTENANSQSGYALYDKAFPSDQGISVKFQYATYAGNGADGIAFFLLDGSTGTPLIGALGGSLGYSDKGSCSAPTQPGITGGYVGIGLDEYGNFSDASHGGLCSAPGRRPHSVTLRGSGVRAPSGTDGGYDYLTHVQLG